MQEIDEKYIKMEEARKELGQYLLGIESIYHVRFHIIEWQKENKHAICTLVPCCKFSWDNNLVTCSLVSSIEKRVISRLDFINTIEWENVEQFFED